MDNNEKNKRCWGLTKNFNRCLRNRNQNLFCEEHKRQPIRFLIFLVFTVIPTVSFYQCFNEDSKSNMTNSSLVDIKIVIQPIPDNYINKTILGIEEFDSKYKRALSYMKAKNYKKAVELFSDIYEIKPDYPTLALHYGQALKENNNNEKALAVWLSVPSSEKYSFLNYNIAATFRELGKYSEAINYYRMSLNDLKKSDCRYWSARAILIALQNKKNQ